MSHKRIIFIFFFLIQHVICQAQTKDSTESETPFRKGRWITELNGMINSGTVIIPDSINKDKKFASNYTFILNGYRLLKDRIGLGIQMSISRSSSEEFIVHESEVFNFGPSFRYYLSSQKHGSAFAQSSVYYTRFYDRSAFLDILNPVDTVLKGKGLGISLGLGYAYVFKDILILEIGFDYAYSWLSGQSIDQINNLIQNTNFKRSAISFSYGVGIIIGK